MREAYQLQIRRDATVHSEEAVIYNAGKREEVEAVHEHLVDLLIVFVCAFDAEIKEVGHLPALVVPAYERNRIWVAYFE